MPATVTFAEYAAAAEARNDINQAILGHTFRLCQALEQDFVNESIRRAEFFATSNPDNKEFYENKIADLKANIGTYQFTVDTGRKYHKVMMTTNGNSRSVHCFVDKKTGEVYKAASHKAPAKGVRFNMLIIKEREFMLGHADWAGGYLYRNASYVG
jgi:N-acetyl-anhydromuramyl-L-alanine amidase AmpD